MAEQDSQATIHPPALHMYTCQQAPAFKLRLKDGDHAKGTEDVYAEFEKGVWKTDDDELAGILDKLISKNAHISALVRKVSWPEARRVVAEASKKYHDMHRMVKGATSTDDLAKAKASTLVDDAIAELRAKGVPEEKITSFVAGLKQEGLTVSTLQNQIAKMDFSAEDAAAVQKQTLPGQTVTQPVVTGQKVSFGGMKR